MLNKSFQVYFLSNYLPFFIVFLWGFGQILPYADWYWHGIAPPDFLAILYLIFFIYSDKKFRNKLIVKFKSHWYPIILISSLIAVLAFSTLLNYEGPKNYIPYLLLSIFRSGYFFVVAILISIWAEGEKERNLLIISYLLSLILVTSWYVINSYSNESLELWGTACGFPIIDQRNVVGNLIGVGLIFSSLLLLKSSLAISFISALFSMVLSYFLLFTYSKGAWLIGLVALFGYFLLLIRRRTLFFLFILFATVFLQLHGSQINCLANAKVSRIADSVSERFSYGLSAWSDAQENLLGRGMGWAITKSEVPTTEGGTNVNPQMASKSEVPTTEGGTNVNPQMASILKNEVSATGYSSYRNPHSAFLHVLQTGGWPALVLYILLLIYPFYLLLLIKGWQFKVFAIAAGCGFFISGATQLQIYSQHFYWIFAGFVFSLTLKSVENN
jgi:hypothetical protein